MRVGIVGAGNVGSTLAELFIRAGHEVTLSHKGSLDELGDLVERLGERAHAATVAGAALFGDIVVLALPFGAYRELPHEPFDSNVVIDATNYYPNRDGHFPELDEGRLTSSELIDRHLVGARLVKTFNSLSMSVLKDRARPLGAPDRIALPVSSDFPEAKHRAAQLVDDAGFDALDLGGLVDGGRLHQHGGPLFGKPLSVEEIVRMVGIGGDQPRAS